MESFYKSALWQGLCGQGIHQTRTLREPVQPRHPPGSWPQVEHEEQAHALVGQDDAAQTLHYRMHQRIAQEQG